MKHMKKLISLILTAVMLFSCTAAFPVSAAATDVEPGSLGDSNGDGKINLFDCSAALQYIAGWEMRANFIPDSADVNGDGKINLMDVRRLLQVISSADGSELG